MKERGINRLNKEEHIEMAKVTMNKYCNSCALGTLCLLDGLVPDLEAVAIAALLGTAD